MLIDPQNPLFRPVVVRLALTALPLCASAYAFSTGWVFVGAGLALVGGYVFRTFFLP